MKKKEFEYTHLILKEVEDKIDVDLLRDLENDMMIERDRDQDY